MTVPKDYSRINDKFDERLAYMIRRHSRVLFFRFDVRFPENYPHGGKNDELSLLLRVVKEQLGENQSVNHIETHYVWCREQHNSANPHYHVVFLVNGNLVQNSYGILQHIARVWVHITNSPNSGLIDFCNHFNGQVVDHQILIERPSEQRRGVDFAQQNREFDAKVEEARRRAYYLGKDDQKGHVPYHVREYGASVLLNKWK